MAAVRLDSGWTGSDGAAEQIPITLTPRAYQDAIARGAQGRNTLVVLPTGLGKTLIAALVARPYLARGVRVVMLAPTRPLVDQHAASIRDLLPGVDVVAVTGTTPPDKRERLWREAGIAITTPQTARNDMLKGRLPTQVGLLVVDEAHRAVGNHAAAEVATALADAGSQVLGLTASPGGDVARIRRLLRTLRIEHIEARAAGDPDVAPYVPGTRLEWVRVPLPEAMREAAMMLTKAAESRVRYLAGMGLYPGRAATRVGLLKARERIDHRMARGVTEPLRRAAAVQAQGMRILHARGLLESQGASVFLDYAHRVIGEDRAIGADAAFNRAIHILAARPIEHPKVRRLAVEVRRHLKDAPDARILVFAQFRDTVHRLAAMLDNEPGVNAAPFVGQGRGKGDGMRQKDQQAAIERFRKGHTNVLVSTSVGEEGLDIPSVGLVIFYEPTASEIRAIQRRGRTGRRDTGRVIILIAKGTSDEAAYWSGIKKERQMRQVIQALRKERPGPVSLERPKLPEPSGCVLIDHRELNGPVGRLLRSRGIQLTPATLPVADFAISDRIMVERKTGRDLVDSILDGRLFEQAKALTQTCQAPMVLVEGNPWTARPGVRPASIAGALAVLATRFGLPVVCTDSPTQTADVIAGLVHREAEEDRGPPSLRHDRPGKSLDERQRFLVEGLPMISAKLADRLLDHFGSPRAVLGASPAQLALVQGVGQKRAATIAEVLDGGYVQRAGDA